VSHVRTFLQHGFLFACVVAVAMTTVSITPASSAAPVAPTGRHELIKLRTPASSTYRNGDGTLTKTIYSEPIRYRENGAWRSIDPTLVPFAGETFAWRNASNRFRTFFARTAAGELLRLRLDGRSYGLSLDGARAAAVKAKGSTAAYWHALDGVDLEYELTADGIKETIVLGNEAAPTKYRFWLAPAARSAVVPERRLDGGWDFTLPGATEPLFTLAAPYALDSAPRPKHGRATMRVRKLGKRFAVDVAVDADWLRHRKRVFPVLVDPTIVIQRSAAGTEESDANLNAACAGCPLTRPTRLSIGTTASEAWRAALQFDLALIPPGAAVTSAAVQLYYDKVCIGGTCPSTAQQFDVHRINRFWQATESLVADVQFDATPLAGYSLPAGAAQRWLSWDVSATVKAWLAQSQPNYGVLIKRADETLGTGGIMIPSGAYGAAPTLRPKLEVTYAGDGIDLAPPDTLHANGAELSWTPYTGEGSSPFQKYEVHRSLTPGFAPSATTLVATIADPSVTTYRDTTAAAGGTFTYKVLRNAVASIERTVTLPAEGLASKTLQPGPADGKHTYLVFINNQTSCATRGRYQGMHVGANASSIRRALLHFDLRDIPSNASVTAATLEVWQSNVLRGSGTVDVHRLTADWTEGTGINTCTGDGATWYERMGGVAWSTVGGDIDGTVIASKVKTAGEQPQWDGFNVTSPVRLWVSGDAPNLGLLLKLRDESFSPCTTPTNCNYWGYFADDYTVAPTLRPKLTVTYADGSQTVRPSIAIASPTQGEVVSGTRTVSTSAGDDGRVARVDFFVDGAQAGASSSPPFDFSWNSTTVAAGTHTLKAVAVDDAGNSTTSAVVSVTVDNSAAPTTTVTSPAGGATLSGTATATAAAADDRGVTRVEFYVDDDRFAETVTTPYTAPLNTTSETEPVYDGSHILTTKAYDAAGRVTKSPGVNVTVRNAPSGSAYSATYASTEFPLSATYDPSLGTQEQYGVDVTVTNTSPVTWGSSMSLRYRWISSDATPTYGDGPNVSLGGTVAPGGSKTVTMLVPAPALPDGVDRARYTLRFDLYDGSASAWFATRGVKPLENPVIVNKALVRDALGLERYYHYVGRDVGAGLQQLTNVANGNSLLRWTPFDEPGRGLSTVLDLTYNALEKKCDCPAGNNWSLAISSLNRFGNPIDIHPNKADQIPGRSNKFVEITDGDGTTHRFTDSNSDGYWQSPPGVHLYLRATGSTDPAKYWALTRPDRVTFYYDQTGFPTSVVDGNGNALTFTQTAVDPGDDPGGPRFKVTRVTDAGGRSFTLVYFTKADAKKPQIRGKLKSITDHVGRELAFEYYLDGNLLRITQKGGLNPDGSLLPDRTFVFTYTTSDGSGPALPTPAERANPDPKTSNQSTRLYSVRDPRGNETRFSYLGPGFGTDRWKLASLTDRAAQTTTFAYDTTNRITTVTEPLSRQSKYAYDVEGKVTRITNPLNQDTTVAWSADRAVARVTEPTGVFTSFTYNDNGYLTSTTDQLGNKTELTYDNTPVDANDVEAKWEAGRSIPHISDLATKTDPKGVATTGVPGDFQWTFAHDAKGNITSVTDPLGKTTTNTYNADGTLAATTDANQHGTSYPSYDANGLATAVVDALGNRTTLEHTAAGELRAVQDPLHQNFTGGDPRTYRATMDYDAFGRLVRQSGPKSTSLEPGNLVWSNARYDANDNVVSQTYPHFGSAVSGGAGGDATTMTYDVMDRITSQVLPHDPASADPAQQSRTLAFAYDAAGRLTVQTDPKGVRTTSTDQDFANFYAYDLLDRVVTHTRNAVDGTGAITQTQRIRVCYDLAGDHRSITAPKGDASFPGCPAATTPYTPLSGNFTTSFTYDSAHQLRSATDPLGQTQSLTYDANGSPDTLTDESGTTARRFYDQVGRVVKEIQPLRGGPTPKELVTQYEYDAVGNLARVISPRAYDASADKQTFTQFVTRYEYDAGDRLVRELLPTSNADTQQLFVHHAYDANGNEIATSLATDQADPNLVAVSEKSQFTYFDPGWVRTSKNPAEPAVSFDWTARGQQSARLRNSRAESWTYFADGALKEEVDAHGSPTKYAYDPNGNLTRLDDTGGVQTPNETELVAEQTFDGFDRLTTIRQQRAGQPWRVTTHAYDLNSNPVSEEIDAVESPAQPGRRVLYTYNALDQVVEQIDKGPSAGCADDQRLQYAYRPPGELADQIASRAGTGCTDAAPGWQVKQQTTRTYLLDGSMETEKTWNGPSAGSTLVQTYALAYEDGAGVYLNGNIARQTVGIASPGAPCPVSSPCTLAYTYDAKDRLTNYGNGRGGSTAYSLLPNGMLAAETFNNPDINFTKTYSYNAPNGVQLNSIGRVQTLPTASSRTDRFFYEQGNLVCAAQDDAQQATRADCTVAQGASPSPRLRSAYAYDDLDRIASAHFYLSGIETDNARWTFDALDRVSSEQETHTGFGSRSIDFQYRGLSGDVVQETWSGSAATTKSYGYDAFGNKASFNDSATGATRFYGYNPHGDVSQLLDVTGAATAAYGYRPYGDEEQGTGAISQGDAWDRANPLNLYRYSAKRFDPGAKSIDMGARMFSPDYGSFLQEDYLRDALQDIDLATDPLTGTRYGLTGGNPINFVEIDGHIFGSIKNFFVGAYNAGRGTVTGLYGLARWSCRSTFNFQPACGIVNPRFSLDPFGIGEGISQWKSNYRVTRAIAQDPGGAAVAVGSSIYDEWRRQYREGGVAQVAGYGALSVLEVAFGSKGAARISVLGRVKVKRPARTLRDRLWLPAFTGKTQGGLVYGDEIRHISSGKQGLASSVPLGTPGFTAYVRTHVEGHAVAFMHIHGIREATLVINNQMCRACLKNLKYALGPGYRLTVIDPDEARLFVGTRRPARKRR
jgi:RHS repeat-associated protein